MKQSLGLKMGQSLTMTPALQQAIRLLQMSSLDLQQEIQQALDSNVMLEMDGDESKPVDAESPEAADEVENAEITAVDLSSDTIPEEMPVDADWSDVYDTAPAPSGTGKDGEDLQDFLQANARIGTTLLEHLHWQAKLAPLSEWQQEVAEYLIDAINDNGWLENFDECVEHFREAMGLSKRQVEGVLYLIQDFDPTGVGARDLAECLRLQLQLIPAETPGRQTALTLIAEHMSLLVRKDVALIARTTDLPAENIEQALVLIQGLQPHPGRPYQVHENSYVAPDVYVNKKNGRWRVSLNPEHQPKLRVNSYYQSFIKRADTSRDQVTMKNHLQEARYFINALEARNETLLRVAQSIVEEQRAFLEYGEEAMRPLVLRDVSEQLGIHESTVSRATANKYMLTPRGLFELKYFFSSHVSTTQGGVASATAIQAMIKRLIAAEESAKPLSDATLAEILLKEGIQVARRTVAKYREALGIPPSHERKPPG
jgi:RNA polymerase sigma-54 factor